MINGSENLLQIAETYSGLIPVFEKHGLGSYFKEENLKKIGRFTRLGTLLQSKNIDVSSFIDALNDQLNAGTAAPQDIASVQENLHFAAMLPCGLRNPFKEFAESYLTINKDKFDNLNYLIEGNVNHELSYYPLLDSIKDEKELPDVIMASDVNNFFHRPFIERFIENDVFRAYEPYEPNSYLEKEGYSDPGKHYTMYTANMLIMAVDKEKLGSRTIPQKWEDLLDPAFENDIIMRGEENFFCNAVMLPFYKEWGFDAIRTLAKNIKSGQHPAEMVKMAGKGGDAGAAVYIMPYFFSRRIRSDRVEIVWPSDGAIASPVFILVKKNKMEEHSALLEFLFSRETGEMIKGRFFPSMHPEDSNREFPAEVKWLGWDFLTRNDIGKLKDDIRDVFWEVWNTKERQS